jgi:hypothetical protein
MTESEFTPEDPMADDVNDASSAVTGGSGSSSAASGTASAPSPSDWTPAEPGEILVEPFAGGLVLNPSCPTLTRAFTGYVGLSPCPDHWRLYSNLEFSDYIEFRKVDVVHNTKYVEYQGSKIGGTGWHPITRTIVWLGVGSRISYGRVRSHTVESAFLSGVVTRESDLDQFEVQSGDPGATGAGSSPAGGFSSRNPC